MQLSDSGKSSLLNTKRQDVGWQEVGTVSSLGFHEAIFIKVLRMFLLTSTSPKKNANTPSCQRSLTCNATAVRAGHRYQLFRTQTGHGSYDPQILWGAVHCRADMESPGPVPVGTSP